MIRTITVLLAALSVAPVAAQKPSILSGVFTKEQAQRGRALYQKNCAVCHGGNLLPRDNDASPLTGPDFELAWHGKTVGQRFDQIRTSMPLAAPGSLGDQEYIDILAFIFQYNGYPAGQQELKADLAMLNQIVIEPVPKKVAFRLGTIPTPFRPSNLAFAGTDLKSLYVVGRGGALRIRMIAEGFKGRPK